MERVDEILEFWFGDGSDPEHERRWFAQDAGFDQACRTGFLADHERAAGGELDSWKDSPSKRARADPSARPVSAQHLPRHAARICHRSQGARDGERCGRARIRPRAAAGPAAFHLSPVSAQREPRRPERIGAALSQARRGASRDGRVRRVRRASYGSHPPLRPLSASQRRAGPRLDARRGGFPLNLNFTNSSWLALSPTYIERPRLAPGHRRFHLEGFITDRRAA